MKSFFSRFVRLPTFRLAVIALGVVAWSNFAFCGEIHDAAENGDLEKIKALLKSNPNLVNSKDTNSDDAALTPLGWAAGFGQKEVAELLLARGAEVNVTNYEGETPLHEAVLDDQKQLAELLLNNKAEVNARDKDGDTPLCFAVVRGNKTMTELLLTNKAEVNIVNNDGRIPLDAVESKDVAELLVAHKADVNFRDKDGWTPLHYAAGRGDTGVVEVLLANKADVNAKNNAGDTPLRLAVENRKKAAADLLRQHGGHE